jgi:hypothetical protein
MQKHGAAWCAFGDTEMTTSRQAVFFCSRYHSVMIDIDLE